VKIRTASELGLLLRERRRELGLRQEELADRIGVSRQWVGKVEKGKQRADAGLVLRVIGALRLVLDVHRDSDTAILDKQARRVDIDAVVRAARRGTR
jgi:HTH-type transcriptional regulator/antitoxin HipB